MFDLFNWDKRKKQRDVVASTQRSTQRPAPAQTDYRYQQRTDGGFDFYRGNNKTTIEDYARAKSQKTSDIRSLLAQRGDPQSQQILTKRKFETQDPEVKRFNQSDVFAQRQRISELQGLANRNQFNSQQDVDNQKWAQQQLQNIQQYGTQQGGNPLTFLQDMIGATTDTYKRLGEGYGEVIGQGVQQKANETSDIARQEEQKTVNRLGELMKQTSDPVEKQRYADAIRRISNIGDVESFQSQQQQAQIAERTDPTKAAGALASVGLDVLTAGAGSKLLQAAGTGLVRGGTEATAKGAGGKLLDFANTVISPNGIKQGMISGSALGTGYGLAGTAEQLGADATAQDYAVGGASGLLLGGALGAGIPAAIKTGRAGATAFGMRGDKQAIRAQIDEAVSAQARKTAIERAQANPKVSNARQIAVDADQKAYVLINERGFSPNSPDVRRLDKIKEQANSFANDLEAKVAQEEYTKNYDTYLKQAQTELRKANRQSAKDQLRALNQEARELVPGGTLAGELGTGYKEAQRAGRVFEGVDGKPRFEIDDSSAKLNDFSNSKPSNGEYLTLVDVLDHPKLYEQYPQLKDVPVTIKNVRGSDASVSSANILGKERYAMTLGKGADKNTVLHEVQHIIQGEEGFARGGSSSQFKTKSIPQNLKDVDFKRFNRKNSIRQRMKELGVPAPHNVKNGDWNIASLENPLVRKLARKHTPELLAQYDELNAQLSKYQTSTAQYERLAGEAEARAVASRMDMPMSERYVPKERVRPQSTGNDFQDILPSGSRPQAVQNIVKNGGNPLYHDTSAQGVLGILESGQIKPNQAPFSDMAGQGPRVSMTRNFDNYSRYGKSPYRLVVDESKTGMRAKPDNRDEFESIFTKPVNAKAIESIAIDVTNPALIDDLQRGTVAEIIQAAKAKGIHVETFEGKLLPDVQANKEIQEMTRDMFAKQFPDLAPSNRPRSTFYDSLDVPKEDLIIRNGGGKAMSIDGDSFIRQQVAEARSASEYRQETISRIWGANKKGSGVDSWMIDEAPGNGTGYIGRGSVSNNSRFYQEFYAEYGRKPTKKEIAEMVDKELAGEQTLLSKTQEVSPYEADIYAQLKDREVVTEPAVKQPTPLEQDLRDAGFTPPAKKSDLSFIETVKNSRNTTDELAERLTSKKSDIITNPATLADASERIKKRGFEKSVEEAKTATTTDTKSQAERLQLISELQRQGRHGDAVEIVEATAEAARRNGQATQVLAAYNRLTPEGVVLSAQRAIKNAKKANPQKHAKLSLSPEQSKKLYDLAKEAQSITPDQKLVQKVADLQQKMDAAKGKDKITIEKQYDKARKELDIQEDKQIMAQKKVQDELLRVVPASNTKKAILLWKAGLLTGIKGALGGSTVGNATNALMLKLKDIPAAGVDAALSKFTGNRTKAFTLRGAFSGFVDDGLTAAWREFKTGGDAADISRKYDYEEVKFSEKPLGKAAQKYTDFVFGVYGAVDKPFKLMATKNSLAEQAVLAAKNQKVPLNKRERFIKDFMASPPAEALEIAVEDGLEATFQQKTALGSSLSGFKRGAWDKNEAMGATTEFVAPFAGIPAAVTTAVLKYNPLGAPVSVFRAIKQASKGQFDAAAQRKLSTALGSQLTGTGIIWLGAALANNNLITLGYPTDHKERKLWEAEGKTAYSIKIGGSWRSLNYTGPLMVLLAAGGRLAQENKKGNDVIGSTAATVLGVPKNILESSPLSGIDKLLDTINTLETTEGNVSKAAERYIGNTLSSAIPTLVGDIAKASDDMIRESNNIIEQIMAKVPGLRNQLQPARDAFGEELKRRNGVIGTMIDPFKSSKSTELDGVKGEIRRLQDAGFGILPTEARDAEGSFKGVPRDQLNEINAQIGKDVTKEWEKVYADPRFAKLSDEDKKRLLDRVNDTVYGAIKSDHVDSKLTKRQQLYKNGSDIDYFANFDTSDGSIAGTNLPQNSLASSFLLEADGVDSLKKSEWDQGELAEEFRPMVDKINSKLPKDVPKLPYTNAVAELYAKFQKEKADNNWSKLELNDKTKDLAINSYKTLLTDNERFITSLSDGDILDAFNAGEISKKEMDKIVDIDNVIAQLGGSSAIGKRIRAAMGYGYAPGSSGSRRSGGKKSGKKGSRKSYKLYGFGDVSSDVSGTLRQLVENAVIKGAK